MSFFGEILGGGAEGLLKGIGDFAISIRTALTGEAPIDATKRAELLLQAQVVEASQAKALLDFQVKMSEGQTAINMLEAKSPSLFVSGWRPSIGWVCSAGLAYQFIIRPLLPWIVSTIALAFGSTVVIPLMPVLTLSELMPLLMGLLGLGGLRTYEKMKVYEIDSTENSAKGVMPKVKARI